MADYNSRCLWCGENVVALMAWWASRREHGLLRVWLCVWERDRLADIRWDIHTQKNNKKRVETTKEGLAKPPCFIPLCDLLWTVLFYAIVVFFPFVLGLICCVSFQLGSRARACTCTRGGGVILCHSLPASQFVAVLSGSGECSRLSFYLSRCLDSAGLNSED